MTRTSIPSLVELHKEGDDFSWGGRVSVRRDYLLPLEKRMRMGPIIHWSSSWERTLREAIEHSTPQSSSWVTFIYRTQDNRKVTQRPGNCIKFRYIGWIDDEGVFHKFNYLTPFMTAVKRVFKELGWPMRNSEGQTK